MTSNRDPLTAVEPVADVRDALRTLGIRRLVLAVHDASFPSLAEDDTGRGTPYSDGGLAFLRFARDLGFDAIQLGPPGQTTARNPSPYDGTLFSRSTLSISLAGLVEEGILPRETLATIVAGRPGSRDRVPYGYVFDAHRRALAEAFRASHPAREAIRREMAAFEERHRHWLERDAVFAALALEHGTDDWRTWPGIDARLYAPSTGEETAADARLGEIAGRHRDALAQYRFEQYLVHRQHDRLRERIGPWGLRIFGDLQVGFSGPDFWANRPLFLERYRLGAPPSRTNREGQPWSYPVLDPRRSYPRGPGRDFLVTRVDKMLSEHDGLRIDHPHGLVCPWVYRADDPDPYHAVQNGARLLDSPHLPDHPELAELAIARADQIEAALPRHADGWVKELTEEQVDRYSWLLDAIVERAVAHGRDPADLPCEVLSTWPYPLRRAMARHGLGRFCVTQKVDPHDPHDLYRSELCRPEDWIMVGNHDTRPVWALAEAWSGTQRASARAAYLAGRLVPDPDRRAAFAELLERDPRELVQAMLADLFAGPAENVLVFFTDLLGMKETYNVPGSTEPDNWTLRVPHDYERLYRERVARGEAADLRRALRRALDARLAAPR